MKARLRLLAFILPELEDHTLFVLAEAVRLKTEDLTLSMEIRLTAPATELLAQETPVEMA